MQRRGSAGVVSRACAVAHVILDETPAKKRVSINKGLARRGAQLRLAELVTEMDSILEAFPDFREGDRTSGATDKGPQAFGRNKSKDARGMGKAPGHR
jgi:hypothetical protein